MRIFKGVLKLIECYLTFELHIRQLQSKGPREADLGWPWHFMCTKIQLNTRPPCLVCNHDLHIENRQFLITLINATVTTGNVHKIPTEPKWETDVRNHSLSYVDNYLSKSEPMPAFYPRSAPQPDWHGEEPITGCEHLKLNKSQPISAQTVTD